MKSQFTEYCVPATCLVTILLAGVAPSLATGAVTTTHYQSRGLTAELGFSSISNSVETNVTISGTQGQGRSPKFG